MLYRLSSVISLLQVDMLSLYKDYIAKFPNTVQILSKLSKTSLFRRVLKKSKQRGGTIGNVQELMQLLVRPIRMLPSYLAFLKVLELIIKKDSLVFSVN